MSKKRKVLIGSLFLVACTALLGLGVYSYFKFQKPPVPTDARQLFNEALANNLKRSSISCTVTQTVNGVTTTQQTWLDLQHPNTTRSTLNTSQSNTSVATEEVMIQGHSYLRYTKLASEAVTKAPEQSKISAIKNVWIDAGAQSTDKNTYTQARLGGCVVPLANISGTRLQQLTSQLDANTVFTLDPRNSQLQTIDGKKTRAYSVSIAAEPYVSFMKQVATDSGTKALNQVQAQAFSGTSTRRATFYVDTKSGELLQIIFPDETKSITFQDFDKGLRLTTPRPTISTTEAQKRFQAVNN